MIRQLCPHCLAAVELPAAAAGSAADCPNCGRPIQVPAGYVPTVDPPPRASTLPEPPAVTDPTPSDIPPPPGFVPPKPPPGAGGDDPRRPPEPGAVGLSPGWLGWVPAAGLTVAFLMTLFPWVGCYPGGVRIYTQSPWQAAAGAFTTNVLPDGLAGDEAELLRVIRVSGWLLLYLPLLLVAVVAAWVERLVPDPAAVPRLAPAAGVWPYRFSLLLGAALLTLLVLLVQTGLGYGLGRAVRQAAVNKVAAEPTPPGATNETNKQILTAARVGMEANRLGVQGTTALEVALTAHLLAAAGAAGRWWLARRGDKPLPRLTLTY